VPTPPTFPDNNNHTITTEGAKPNQGAHVLLSKSNAKVAPPLSGIGSVVTGKGLAWYNPSFTVGNKGYQDPSYYWCFRGIKENFPPIGNWMNFYDMFNLNQRTTMVRFDSGPEQGEIYNAIVRVSQEAKVDARLILAVIMQEVPFPSSPPPPSPFPFSYKVLIPLPVLRQRPRPMHKQRHPKLRSDASLHGLGLLRPKQHGRLHPADGPRRYPRNRQRPRLRAVDQPEQPDYVRRRYRG